MAAARSSPLLLVLIIITLVSVLISTTKSQNPFNCANVEINLAQCLPYLTGTGPMCTTCCAVVSEIYNQVISAGNNAALQSACQCLQNLANNLPGIDYDAAENLPQQCGVNLPFAISPNIDCYNF